MIMLRHPSTNLIKECPTGYSWTTCFFAVFVPLFRGDLKYTLIFILISMFTAACTFFIGALFVSPIFAYFYNKLYIKDLLEKGYVAADDRAQQYLIDENIVCGL